MMRWFGVKGYGVGLWACVASGAIPAVQNTSVFAKVPLTLQPYRALNT